MIIIHFDVILRLHISIIGRRRRGFTFCYALLKSIHDNNFLSVVNIVYFIVYKTASCHYSVPDLIPSPVDVYSEVSILLINPSHM